ncbi:MAG: hypothetical protein R3F49_10300 [Planctomycetota bacterium]
MPATITSRIALSAPLVLSAALPAAAQCWDQHLSTGIFEQSLAGDLAYTSGRLAVGLPRRNPTGSAAIRDSVRVYEGVPGAMSEVARLESSLSVQGNASFGVAVDLEGDWLAVGDPNGFDPALGSGGAVHLYQRTPAGWTLQQVLFQPQVGVTFGSSFGAALDLDQDLLVVGAPFASTSSTQGVFEDGIAYVFQRGPSGWQLLHPLAPNQAQLFGGFGTSVAIDGDFIAVGETGRPIPGGTPFVGGNAGAVHVYCRCTSTQFTPVTMLQASVPIAGALLGSSVAISGTTIVSGAIGEPQGGVTSAGRAYIFEANGQGVWSETSTLAVPPLRAYMHFGDDVRLIGDTLYVTSESLASAWRYERLQGVWTEAERYTTGAGVAWPTPMPVRVGVDGDSVALSDPDGVTLLPRVSTADARVGCDAAPMPPSSPSFPGVPVYLDVRDELRRSSPSLRFNVYGGSAVGTGILFYGFTPTTVSLGTGTRCVGGALTRAAVGVPTPGGTQTPLLLDLQAGPANAGPWRITAGVDVHFQYWFRTAGGSSHLTNSLVLNFCP